MMTKDIKHWLFVGVLGLALVIPTAFFGNIASAAATWTHIQTFSDGNTPDEISIQAINGTIYLSEDGGKSSPSIYRWRADSERFSFFQDLPGFTGGINLKSGKHESEMFSFGGDVFVVTGTEIAGTHIKKWNGSQFVTFQVLPENSHLDVAAFSVGSGYYLALDTGDVYRYNSSSFVRHSTFSSSISDVSDLEAFVIGDSMYMAITGNWAGPTIKRWTGSGFTGGNLLYPAPAGSVADFEAYEISGVHYVALATHFGSGPRIYRFNGSEFTRDIGAEGDLASAGATKPGTVDDLHTVTSGGNHYLVRAKQGGQVFSWNGSSWILDSVLSNILDEASDIESFTANGMVYVVTVTSRSAEQFKVYRVSPSVTPTPASTPPQVIIIQTQPQNPPAPVIIERIIEREKETKEIKETETIESESGNQNFVAALIGIIDNILLNPWILLLLIIILILMLYRSRKKMEAVQQELALKNNYEEKNL